MWHCDVGITDGVDRLVDIRDYPQFAGITIDHFARIGVILLLFQIGLESSLVEMRKVVTSSKELV